MIEALLLLIAFLVILLLIAVFFYWIGYRAGKAKFLISALENGERTSDAVEFTKEPQIVVNGTGNNRNEILDRLLVVDEYEGPVIPAANYILYNDDDINAFRTTFEIEKRRLHVLNPLGQGYFGVVRKAILTCANASITVAIKNVATNWDGDKPPLWEELKAIAAAGLLPNVLAFLGFTEPERRLTIITEYCDGGDLLCYLKSRRDVFEDKLEYFAIKQNKVEEIITEKTGKYRPSGIEDDSLDSLCTFDLLSFAYQIANGMKHLKSVAIVHNDLALRNVLLNNDKTIRIGDFRSSKRIETDRYHIQSADTAIPVVHIAPEVFEDFKFSEETDVWAFGVTLYELFTLGRKPYDQMHPHEIKTFLGNGGRLGEPEYCTREVYNFMLDCWSQDPDKRPNFSRCKQFFEQHFDQHNLPICENVENKLRVTTEEQRRLRSLIQAENHLSNF